MADGTFGGDGSVKWVVDVDSVRPNSVDSSPKGTKGHHQHGTDETPDNSYFTVTIKKPKDSNALTNLVATLRTWVNGPNGPLAFDLPIENNNEDQIRIHWPSKP